MPNPFSIIFHFSFLVLASIAFTGTRDRLTTTINKTSTKFLIHENPCEAARAGVDTATVLSQTSVFSDATKRIQQAAADGREHSITFGRDANGNISFSNLVHGDTARGRVSSNWSGAFADLHNHNSNQPPSAGDLYYLVKINKTNAGYNTRFVIAANGSVYALHIYNSRLANDFVASYPMEQSPGFSPRFPEPIFDHIDKVSIYFQSKNLSRSVAQERALAFVLEKYYSGTALLKQDSTGIFKIVRTEEVKQNGVVTYRVSDCR